MKETLLKGMVGTGAPLLGTVASIAQIKEWLQIVSLVVGIAVGVATFVIIVRKKK